MSSPLSVVPYILRILSPLRCIAYPGVEPLDGLQVRDETIKRILWTLTLIGRCLALMNSLRIADMLPNKNGTGTLKSTIQSSLGSRNMARTKVAIHISSFWIGRSNSHGNRCYLSTRIMRSSVQQRSKAAGNGSSLQNNKKQSISDNEKN